MSTALVSTAVAGPAGAAGFSPATMLAAPEWS